MTALNDGPFYQSIHWFIIRVSFDYSFCVMLLIIIYTISLIVSDLRYELIDLLGLHRYAEKIALTTNNFYLHSNQVTYCSSPSIYCKF